MTTLEDVTKKRAEPSAEAAAAAELVRLAKEQGLSLTGPGRPAQTVHQNRPGNRTERGDDRAPRARQKPSSARSGVYEHSKRNQIENGADRGQRSRSDRGPS